MKDFLPELCLTLTIIQCTTSLETYRSEIVTEAPNGEHKQIKTELHILFTVLAASCS